MPGTVATQSCYSEGERGFKRGTLVDWTDVVEQCGKQEQCGNQDLQTYGGYNRCLEQLLLNLAVQEILKDMYASGNYSSRCFRACDSW